MATQKQVKAAKRNVQKAQAGARKNRSIAKMPARTRTALGKQGAAVAQRKRTGGSSPKTRQELYEEAKRRGLPGRSKMGRDELARALGPHVAVSLQRPSVRPARRPGPAPRTRRSPARAAHLPPRPRRRGRRTRTRRRPTPG
jgi:hypothetical protein